MKKNSATDNIRRVTEEIQQVYDDLSSLAQGVHHTKALYGGIMTINDRYGQLIGTLVHELKMASDAKLKVILMYTLFHRYFALLLFDLRLVDLSLFMYIYYNAITMSVSRIASTRCYR